MNTNTPLEQLLKLKETVKPTDCNAIRTLLCKNDLRFMASRHKAEVFISMLLASRGRTIGEVEINDVPVSDDNPDGTIIEVIVNLEKP